MTSETCSLTGAPSALQLDWDSIEWKKIETQVKRLQMRIAKAVREGRKGKAKALQWLLTHSYTAKQLAVRRVVQNQGSKSPGVDNVVWRTSRQKAKAVQSLTRKGYTPLPLKRVYIPKKKGKRPLSIPCMKDRAMQALYLLALEPVSETKADYHSYGFRPKRSTADALVQCFNILSRKHSAQWVLEGDIKACFDRICHTWLLKNTLMDTEILHKWLKAGYMEKGSFFSTLEGTPQGGIISPTLMNMALDGLELTLKKVTQTKDKVHYIRYADDFIISGASKEVLVDIVRPTVDHFLKKRGLELSMEKTKITHIEEGFDFLGFNVRKYKGKFLSKPSKQSIKSFLDDLRETIKSHPSAKVSSLLLLLNPKIRGWTNYYRHVASKKVFGTVDYRILQSLYRWARRRHPNKYAKWVQNKYFRTKGINNWIFSTRLPKGNFDIVKANEVTIVRHIKIRGEANPYDPKFNAYFQQRECSERSRPSTTGDKVEGLELLDETTMAQQDCRVY